MGSVKVPPSYQPGADQISKCRWQPEALPVSPTVPIGWPVLTRLPTGSSERLGEVHIGVVLAGARDVDHQIVAGRSLVAGVLDLAAAGGDEGVPQAAKTSWP